MSQRDVSREEDKGETREEAVGDLDVRHAEDVRGGEKGENEKLESITFVYWRI